MIRKTKNASMALSAVMLILGLLLLLWPGMSVKILSTIIGILFLTIGIVKILGYFSNDLYHLAFQFDLAFGIFTGLFGILLIARPMHILAILPTVIGIFILADGVLRIQTAKDAKIFGMEKWWKILVLGLVTVLFGALLIFKPFESTVAMLRLLGVAFLVDGIQNLLVVLDTVKTGHSYINGKYREIR